MTIGEAAKLLGMSAQQIRNYEKDGLISPTVRTSAGYRVIRLEDIEAIRAIRRLIRVFGWSGTCLIAKCIDDGHEDAIIQMCQVKFEALERRREVSASLAALISSAIDAPLQTGDRTFERIGRLAGRLGISVSALRHWELSGLVESIRDPQSNFRKYTKHQQRQAELIALLRRAGYSIDSIRKLLVELDDGSRTTALRISTDQRNRFQEQFVNLTTAMGSIGQFAIYRRMSRSIRSNTSELPDHA